MSSPPPAPVLGNVCAWLQFTGVLEPVGSSRSNGRSRRRRVAAVTLAFTVLIVPQCLYVKEVLTDAFDMIFVLITSIAFAATYAQFCVLVASPRAHFDRCESRLTHLCRLMDRGIMFSLAVFLLMPVAQTVGVLLFVAPPADAADGQHPDAVFAPLYYDKYYYVDLGRSAWRLAANTVVSMWATSMNAVVFVSTPQLFGSLCVYVRAMYDELLAQLRRIDEGAVGLTDVARAVRVTRLRRALRFHLGIVDIVAEIQLIFSGVIGLQFAYCLVSMSLCVFLVSYTGFADGSVVLVIACCFLSTLLVYCWLGTLLIAKGDELQASVYGTLNWYTYAASEQRLVHFMLMRSQRNRGLSAFDYYFCTAETFANIISNVFSVIAFLQNML